MATSKKKKKAATVAASTATQKAVSKKYYSVYIPGGDSVFQQVIHDGCLQENTSKDKMTKLVECCFEDMGGYDDDIDTYYEAEVTITLSGPKKYVKKQKVKSISKIDW